jgi:hypothetical protein
MEKTRNFALVLAATVALCFAVILFTQARKRLELDSPRIISAQTMSDEVFLAHFDLEEVISFLKGGDILGAKTSLLNHYNRRTEPAWPAPPKTITDFRINIDDLSQADLLSLANSILEYHFPPEDSKPRLTPDGNIDWCFNPVSDREWLWRLNRHQWWPILGLAYSRTLDERYATAFVNQMLHWISANPPPQRKNEKSPTWRLMEVALRMRVSWIPAFALFSKSPSFTDEAKFKMLKSIYDHAQFLSLFKGKTNHILRENNGLAYVSVYFPEFKEAKRWQQIALARLDSELTKQVNPDGSHFEVSTGYQWLVVDEYEKTYELLQTNNLSLPKKDLASWLEKMYQVLAFIVRPDGTFPQVNDGMIHWSYTRLARAGEKFKRGDFIYIGSAGKRGVPPKSTSVAFSDAGLYVMRSDWSKDARYLLFDAGPYGGGHGHEDKLSIELFAFGQPFVVDSGSYTYDSRDPYRAYVVSSHAHNTVLVNGQSQIRRWQKDNRNPKSALENYAIWISHRDFDYAAATYSEGYSSFSLKKPKNQTIINDVSHTRRILFVKPDYWVLVDELKAANPYNYQLLFHTSPEMRVSAGPQKRIILRTGQGAPCLFLIPTEPQSIKVKWVAGSEKPIQGWYSSSHHQIAPANVIIYERENSFSTILTTLLYPCPGDQSCDEVKIESLKVSGGKGLAFVVTTASGRDYLMFAKEGTEKNFGPYQTRAIVAGIRLDKRGEVLTRFEWTGG